MSNAGHQKARADGSAYGRPLAHPDCELTQVGPGTPCGELMRRYWQPVGLSSQLTHRPASVQILGEDLILFRNKKGRPGLLYPRCMHRGTNLFYGKVTEQGIACCYHGWEFDTEGRCLLQSCEPGGGRNRAVARQPWYPVQERYGMVFAYMGPPKRKPLLPCYDILEDLGPDEELRVDAGGFGATLDHSLKILPYSWLQMNDNAMDPFHVHVLHSTFSVVQFVPEFALMPTVDFFTTPSGVCYSAKRKLQDGREYERISSWLLPNILCIPNTFDIGPAKASRIRWILPVDDSHFTMFTVSRMPRSAPPLESMRIKGKLWSEMTDEERQDTPSDYEAQAGQGRISLHSEEHLASTDRGIIMQRRMLRAQIRVVADGGDPIGITFDQNEVLVSVRSGNIYKTPSVVGGDRNGPR